MTGVIFNPKPLKNDAKIGNNLYQKSFILFRNYFLYFHNLLKIKYK